jgi:hypothetical protein
MWGMDKTLAWPHYPCRTYVICVCLRIEVSNTCWVVFLFCYASSYVPYVAQFSGFLFFIIPSVFSNIYFVWIVLYCVVLCISLFCHLFIYYCIVCPSSKYDYLCFFIPVLREFTTGFSLSWNFSIISFMRSLWISWFVRFALPFVAFLDLAF